MIIREYWMRVVIVWIWLLCIVLGITALLMAPSFILLSTQVTAYQSQYQEAQLQQVDFQKSEDEVKRTNALATHLNIFDTTTNFSVVIRELDKVAGRDIRINHFQLNKSGEEIKTIRISGVAKDRSTLASFSDRVVEHPLFDDANVPIANLVKDKDINFDIDVVPSNSKFE